LTVAIVEDLVNKGIIVHQPSAQPGRTFIVTGPYRSGTSLVAAVLREAGLFIGDAINDIVYEDEEIAGALDSGNIEALRTIVAARAAGHARWGFKYPMLSRALQPPQLDLFDTPRLIVTLRDPVAMAVRTSLSEYREPMRSLREAAADQMALLAFIGELACPSLLLSYEKALAFPGDVIAAILRFCGIPCDDALRARLCAIAEPNRPRYLAGARRRIEGLIEGVRDGQLYGWCRLTQWDEPVSLEVLVDERLALTVSAAAFRQDLVDAGIGKGCHGYFVPLMLLQARPDSIVRVRVAQHGVELDNSGRRLCDFGTSA
jgi:hypothetical protein